MALIKVAEIVRNGWPACPGIGGRNQSELVAGIIRKSRPESSGIRRYHRYVYEAGAISRPDKMHRTRYFTDSGIIGSKEFVGTIYQRFKHLFFSKHEKKPKPIKGLGGMYSLKRLSEVI